MNADGRGYSKQCNNRCSLDDRVLEALCAKQRWHSALIALQLISYYSEPVCSSLFHRWALNTARTEPFEKIAKSNNVVLFARSKPLQWKRFEKKKVTGRCNKLTKFDRMTRLLPLINSSSFYRGTLIFRNNGFDFNIWKIYDKSRDEIANIYFIF